MKWQDETWSCKKRKSFDKTRGVETTYLHELETNPILSSRAEGVKSEQIDLQELRWTTLDENRERRSSGSKHWSWVEKIQLSVPWLHSTLLGLNSAIAIFHMPRVDFSIARTAQTKELGSVEPLAQRATLLQALFCPNQRKTTMWQ